MEDNQIQDSTLSEQSSPSAFPISDNTMRVLECLVELEPYIEDNLGLLTAHKELGNISADDYNYVLTRHRDANLVMSIVDFENKCLSDEKFGAIPNYEDRMNMVAAWCIVDVRAHATEDLKGKEQAELLDLIDKLCMALKDCGYTKILPSFKIPIK